MNGKLFKVVEDVLNQTNGYIHFPCYSEQPTNIPVNNF